MRMLLPMSFTLSSGYVSCLGREALGEVVVAVVVVGGSVLVLVVFCPLLVLIQYITSVFVFK